LFSDLNCSTRSARRWKNEKSLRFNGDASVARTRSEVSKFSQIRGGAITTVGPSSRKSRCTVSGLSGQLATNPTSSASTSDNSESPIHAIGR